ncbi:motility protein A [Tersicoccus sp. Bi-70]|uniref:motility protein A n=1 Tax=Tersicoccus sp. Bi-70 TaxID=1897634 RepID=UPI000978917A|nr:MotA/TolQ/ExbB proton channel family protein [Tersicoccus sp. Bi-70]OMH30567.1 flagellar motor protein MotA [Tersicoccus sp. Bi-70]
MDPATLIGLVLAFGSVFAMVTLEGASVMSLLLPPPMILVFGATIAVGFAGHTLKDGIHAFSSIPKALMGKTTPPQQSIDTIIGLAEKARADGLLALESEAAGTKDPFLAGALQNIADGTDPEELRILLEDEMATRSKSDKAAAKFFSVLGGYAPTIGIVGTVVSLTHVLENLSKPEELGHMIASAFVATLWGLLSANFMWLPLSGRLGRLAELESERMLLLMEGVLAVQSGTQPLLLAERLKAMVPVTQRKDGKAKAGKAKSGAGATADSLTLDAA